MCGLGEFWHHTRSLAISSTINTSSPTSKCYSRQRRRKQDSVAIPRNSRSWAFVTVAKLCALGDGGHTSDASGYSKEVSSKL